MPLREIERSASGVVVFTDEPGRVSCKFQIYAKNGKLLHTSRIFATRSAARQGLAHLKKALRMPEERIKE